MVLGHVRFQFGCGVSVVDVIMNVEDKSASPPPPRWLARYSTVHSEGLVVFDCGSGTFVPQFGFLYCCYMDVVIEDKIFSLCLFAVVSIDV